MRILRGLPLPPLLSLTGRINHVHHTLGFPLTPEFCLGIRINKVKVTGGFPLAAQWSQVDMCTHEPIFSSRSLLFKVILSQSPPPPSNIILNLFILTIGNHRKWEGVCHVAGPIYLTNDWSWSFAYDQSYYWFLSSFLNVLSHPTLKTIYFLKKQVRNYM